MIAALITTWLAMVGQAPAAPPSPDLHLAVEYQFNFLANVITRNTDWWMAPQRTASRVGDRLTIRREDLGVSWRVDVKASTYTETKIAPPAPQPAAPVAEDIHTVGFDYEPDYDWQVRETHQRSTIAGRPCRQFVATGDADYAEATVTFWVCQPVKGITYAVNDAVMASMRSESAKRMITDTLARQGRAWVLGVEEKQEPAISPVMIVTLVVKALDAGTAPAGTFALPANVSKAER